MSNQDEGAKHARPPRRRISYANVAATLALVIALGAGTAYAAKHHWLITSRSQIKPSVLHSLKGKHGRQGLAGATGATGATGGTGGIGATGATGLISNMLQWNATVATPGAGIGTPNTVTLETVGPFTVTGYCYISGSNTVAATYGTTSQNGSGFSAYSGNEHLDPWNTGDAEDLLDTDAKGATSTSTPGFSGPDDGSWAFSTANGSVVVNGFGNQGVYMQGSSGPACSFSGYLVKQGG
jgi:hypothetical protein